MNHSRMRYLMLLPALLLGISPMHAQSGKGLLIRADSLTRIGRHNEAIALLDAALAREPKNTVYLLARGHSHASAKHYEKAREDYFTALMVDPECAQCLLDLGTIEAINGSPRAALSFLNRSIDLERNLGPKDIAEAYYMRAQVQEALGERTPALTDYDQAVRLSPTRSEYLIGRGMFYLLGENMEQAHTNFDAAVQADPESTRPYLYRARYHITRQQWKEALEDLNHCIAMDPLPVDPILARGTTYLSMERYAEALADYDTVLARDQSNINAYYNRALVLYKLEDMDGSCRDTRQLLALLEKDGQDPAMQIEARRNLQRQCDSAYPGYYYHRGVAAYNRNDFEGAIASYDRGLQQFPNDPMLLYFRGNACLAAGRYAETIRDYGLVLQVQDAFLANMIGSSQQDTTDAGAFFLMSIYHGLFEANYGLKDYDGALSALDRTLAATAHTTVAGTDKLHFERGSLLMLQGRQQEALHDLDKTIQINPEFAPAYLFKAIALLNDKEPSRYQISSVDLDFEDSRSSSAYIKLPASTDGDDTGSTVLEKVLDAANRAIELDSTLGYAYVVRGYASMLAKRRSYCDDFNTANIMGVREAEPLVRTYCR